MFSFRFSRFDDIFEDTVAQADSAAPVLEPLPTLALKRRGRARVSAAATSKAAPPGHAQHARS